MVKLSLVAPKVMAESDQKGHRLKIRHGSISKKIDIDLLKLKLPWRKP